MVDITVDGLGVWRVCCEAVIVGEGYPWRKGSERDSLPYRLGRYP